LKKRFHLAALVACALAGAAALQAVPFGEPDGNRHPFVGTIIFQLPSGYFSCSGTLLSSTVFLTAGHCTEEGGVANLNTWVTFAPIPSFAGRENYPSLGAFLDDRKNGWVKGDAIAHPRYNDFAEFPATYDVGVVLLRKGVSKSTYGALPPLGFLEGIRRAADNKFTTVGYGMQGLIKPFLEDIYERYQGQVKLVELNSTFDGGMSAKFSSNPGTGGGSCFGDSGGPVFYGTTNMVVAVVSWGNTPCIGVDYQFRVDTAIAQDFVRQYVR
jgi:trypsin